MESGGIRPPAAAAVSPMTAEEEAMKRNTDCVYFLASPLTCKKGNECEYRHSEAARVNPRDCWYWLNGTCMNPKCAFRHPPLDGLFGAPPTPAVPQVTAPSKIAPSNKSVPCYYFQKGNCLKGDRCPFTHGPASSGSNPPSKVSPSTPLPPKEQPIISQKTNPNPKFVSNNRIINNNNNNKPVSNVSKPALNFNRPIEPKSIPKAETLVNNKPMLANNNNNYKSNNFSDEERPDYPHNQFPVNRGAQVQNREILEDSRDGSEFLGESSPGFDVLVDHDEQDSSRFLPPNEENHHQIRRAYNEMYPLDHDYEILPRHEFERERERYGVPQEQDYHQPEFDQFERNKRPRRENSRDRDLDRPSRRQSSRDEMDSEMNGSDLRLRLMSKQRRANGSRPEVNRESRDHRREDRSNRHRNERRVSVDRVDHLDHVDRIGRGTRLHGRIKMPERKPDLMHLEMERDNRRRNFRVSPVRPREIMRPRSSEFVGAAVGRPGFRRSEEDFVNFAGPKSLRELKGGKMSEKGEERRGSRERESSLDFEGPKPLSVILKRKREAAGTGSGSSSETKFQNDDSTPKEEKVNAIEGEEEEIEEGMIQEGDNGNDMNEKETEEGPYDANDCVEREEEYKMEEGEEEYKEGEEEYKEGEQEYKEGEEEYYEEEEVNEEYLEEYEDDEDDFAKKVGVVI
ncbi:hypothetical protein LUZ60_012026 [Juncus effusus]|nr:hypothetical protein LUZ60_012026 [Juncus effusus]